MQVTRGKQPGAINHGMYQDRSDFETLLRHRPEMVARYNENFQRFQGSRIPWRGHEPRIRQHTGNISFTPLNDLVRPSTTIDEQSQSPGKNDVKSLHLATFHTQHFASIQLSNGPVCCQPLELRPGRWAQGFVSRQPIDKILCYHWRAISQSEEELLPNNISDGKLDFALRVAGNLAIGEIVIVSPTKTCDSREKIQHQSNGRLPIEADLPES